METTKRKKKRKAFDCVEFQHEAGARLLRETAGMSREELNEYWKKRNEEARRIFEELRKSAPRT